MDKSRVEKPKKADEIWCLSCAGCNLLEDKSFKGVTSCENFRDDGIIRNVLIDSVIKSWQQRMK
mgnify:CR=1 FL=1